MDINKLNFGDSSAYFKRSGNYNDYGYSIPSINNKGFIELSESSINLESLINSGKILFPDYTRIRTKFFVNTGEVETKDGLNITSNYSFIGKNAQFSDEISITTGSAIIEEGWKGEVKLAGKIQYLDSEKFQKCIVKLEENSKNYVQEIIKVIEGRNFKILHESYENENQENIIYA